MEGFCATSCDRALIRSILSCEAASVLHSCPPLFKDELTTSPALFLIRLPDCHQIRLGNRQSGVYRRCLYVCKTGGLRETDKVFPEDSGLGFLAGSVGQSEIYCMCPMEIILWLLISYHLWHTKKGVLSVCDSDTPFPHSPLK